MRKSSREIKDKNDIIDVVERCDTIRVGIHDEEYPYVVPLSFGYSYDNEKLIFYFHGATEGFKHDLIKKNSKVCVEADICHRFTDTNFGVTCEYESFIGFGKAERVYGDELDKGIALILDHCGFAGYECNTTNTDFMAVYKIEIDSFTGKRRTV